MNTWQKAVAAAVGITAVIGAIQLVVAVAGEVQTDGEAQIWREDHVLTEAEKFKADRIDRVERENDRIEYDLLDEGLRIKEIDFLNRQLKKNDAKIKCIQEGTC